MNLKKKATKNKKINKKRKIYKEKLEQALSEIQQLSKEAENFFGHIEDRFCKKGPTDGDK